MTATVTSRRRPRLRAATVVRFLVVLVAAAVVFFPVWTSFVSAFLPSGVVVRDGVLPWPGSLTLRNFVAVTTSVHLVPQYLVSVAVVTLHSRSRASGVGAAGAHRPYRRWCQPCARSSRSAGHVPGSTGKVSGRTVNRRQIADEALGRTPGTAGFFA